MPLSPDDGMLFDPKWFVIGFALVALGLIGSYDLRLGLAAGAVLGIFGAAWLAFALRYGLVGDDRPSNRRQLLGRFRQQLSNRRKAARRKDEPSGS